MRIQGSYFETLPSTVSTERHCVHTEINVTLRVKICNWTLLHRAYRAPFEPPSNSDRHKQFPMAHEVRSPIFLSLSLLLMGKLPTLINNNDSKVVFCCMDSNIESKVLLRIGSNTGSKVVFPFIGSDVDSKVVFWCIGSNVDSKFVFWCIDSNNDSKYAFWIGSDTDSKTVCPCIGSNVDSKLLFWISGTLHTYSMDQSPS